MVVSLIWVDNVTVAVYFAIVLVIALWATLQPSKGTSGYFLAGKGMTWIPIGASIFASNVGSGKFIGLTGSGAASGFAVAVYEWHAVYLLIFLGWLLAPVYIASGAFTIPEYLKKRFGGKRLGTVFLIIQLFHVVGTRISIEIYSGAVYLKYVLGWDLYLSGVVILVVAAIYSTAGGLTAVIYTDTLHTSIILVGGLVTTIMSFNHIGGWESMTRKYMMSASNYTLTNRSKYACGLPRDDAFHIWRDVTTGDTPWLGAVVGLTLMGMNAWCIDQVIIQRSLSGRALSHVKAGTILASFLKIFNFFIFILPGMISRALYPNEVACADPSRCKQICENPAGCSNIAYPLLVERIIPKGLRGLMLASLLAALMSSLTAIYSSTSTLVTMDIWRAYRPQAKERELMVVGRFVVLMLTALSILWIPILQSFQGAQLWSYLQAITSYLTPPLAMVVIVAIFWRRATEAGVFWSLICALGIGFARMVMDFIFPVPRCGSDDPDTRPAILSKVNFLHFAIIVSAGPLILLIAISIVTHPIPASKLHGLTWWTRNVTASAERTTPPAEGGSMSISSISAKTQFIGHRRITRMFYRWIFKIESESERIIEESEANNIVERTVHSKKKESSTFVFYKWICGLEDSTRTSVSTPQTDGTEPTSNNDSKFWSRILDICAIVVSVLTAFLLGFFA